MGKAFDKMMAGLREVRASLAIGGKPLLSENLPLPSVTRFVLVDHSAEGDGRILDQWGLKDVMISIQDEGRTLKVFVR